jgi:hypothetical protein
MTGDVQEDTLGFWLNQHYPGKPRRLMSALGAILVDQGVAKRIKSGRGVRIRFL